MISIVPGFRSLFYFFLAAQGLQGLQARFLAAQGLQGLQPPFLAAHGLQGLQACFLAAQGLHGLQAASSMISWLVTDFATASGRTLMAPAPARTATLMAVTVFFIIFSSLLKASLFHGGRPGWSGTCFMVGLI
jgi:hypothetical protein